MVDAVKAAQVHRTIRHCAVARTGKSTDRELHNAVLREPKPGYRRGRGSAAENVTCMNTQPALCWAWRRACAAGWIGRAILTFNQACVALDDPTGQQVASSAPHSSRSSPCSGLPRTAYTVQYMQYPLRVDPRRRDPGPNANTPQSPPADQLNQRQNPIHPPDSTLPYERHPSATGARGPHSKLK